jgi:hypothetical protein
MHVIFRGMNRLLRASKKEASFLSLAFFSSGHVVNIAGFFATSSQAMIKQSETCQARRFGRLLL